MERDVNEVAGVVAAMDRNTDDKATNTHGKIICAQDKDSHTHDREVKEATRHKASEHTTHKHTRANELGGRAHVYHGGQHVKDATAWPSCDGMSTGPVP